MPKVLLKWALGLYIFQALVGIVVGLAFAFTQTGVI